MSPEILAVFSVIGVIASMILLYVLVLPESRYASLPKFWKWIADFLHFRKLWLESIIKFIYILLSVICVVVGFFCLFTVVRYGYYSQSFAGFGIILMIAGPVVVRITYEATIMFIILVKNVMQINNRLRNKEMQSEESETQPEIVEESAPAPQSEVLFCTNCGCQIGEGVSFCANCGNKVR